MTWHYCIRRRPLEDSVWYDIVEFYDGGKGQKCWTIEGMTPGSETRKGLIETLEMMLKDAKHYKTVVDKK